MLLTSKYFCTRFNEIHASTNPFNTHGNAFNGPIIMLSNATLAKVVAAVIGIPRNVDAPNVNRFMIIGVVAQKYTHIASKYFLFDNDCSSRLRKSIELQFVSKNSLNSIDNQSD